MNTHVNTPKKLCILLIFSPFNGHANWVNNYTENFNNENSLEGKKSLWKFDIGGGPDAGWGSKESQYYNNEKGVDWEIKQLTKKNKYLRIWGRRSPNYMTSCNENNKKLCTTYDYRSARINTQFLYTLSDDFRMTVRVRWKKTSKVWPAVYTLGTKWFFRNWPKGGEIDLLEGKNTGDSVATHVHFENENGEHEFLGKEFTIKNVDEWHEYQITRKDKKLTWKVDGKTKYTLEVDRKDMQDLFEDHFIVISLALGGNFPGGPANFTGTTYFDIDWLKVEIYKKD